MDRATQAKSKRDGLLSPKIEKADLDLHAGVANSISSLCFS